MSAAVSPQDAHRLAVYLAAVYPEVQQGSVVASVLWLLEHLRRIETIQPPVVRTLYTCEQAERALLGLPESEG